MDQNKESYLQDSLFYLHRSFALDNRWWGAVERWATPGRGSKVIRIDYVIVLTCMFSVNRTCRHYSCVPRRDYCMTRCGGIGNTPDNPKLRRFIPRTLYQSLRRCSEWFGVVRTDPEWFGMFGLIRSGSECPNSELSGTFCRLWTCEIFRSRGRVTPLGRCRVMTLTSQTLFLSRSTHSLLTIVASLLPFFPIAVSDGTGAMH
jgi:hypothetical protein